MNRLSNDAGETAAVLGAEHAASVGAAYSALDTAYHDLQTVIGAMQFLAGGSLDASAEHNRDALLHIFGLTGIAERLCESDLFANGALLAQLAGVANG